MTAPTTSLDLLGMVQAALVACNTDLGNRIYRPGDWPTQPGQYPIGKLRLVSESRLSLGHGATVEFITTATIRLLLECSEPAQVDDTGAAAVEQALWQVKRQAEIAVIGSYPLELNIQRVVSIQSQLAFTTAATHLAGVQMDIALEFYEGPESFAPVVSADLDEVDVSTVDPAASAVIPTS